jgi:hypothetical protein
MARSERLECEADHFEHVIKSQIAGPSRRRACVASPAGVLAVWMFAKAGVPIS